MNWQKDGTDIAVMTLPLCSQGDSHDFSLTFTTGVGEVITDAYLFIAEPESLGLFFAKLSTDSIYKEIKGPFNPHCYLGNIPESASVEIDFRLLTTDPDKVGYYLAQLGVGSGTEYISALPLYWNPTYLPSYWGNGYDDTPIWWNGYHLFEE
jgi:hypothetical protein